MPLNRALRSYHEVYPEWARSVENRALTDFLFHLQVQIPEHIAEISEYRSEYGIACMKIHFDYRIDDPVLCPMDIAKVNDGYLYRTMEEVAKSGGIVAVHCENTHVASIIARAVREAGGNDLLSWGRAKPAVCEALDVDLVGGMAHRLGCRAMAVHLSSGLALDAARKYSRDALEVETVIGFLTMTLDELSERVGIAAKGNPPFRTAEDRELLWQGLRDGRIQTVGTDNVLRETVGRTSIWDTGVGHCTMEYALPLLLTFGVHEGRLGLEQLGRVLSIQPAKIYGIADRKRGISVGGDADITLVDMSEWRTVSPERSLLGYRTIGDGLRLTGWPRMTMLRGTVTYDGADLTAGGVGTVLRSTI